MVHFDQKSNAIIHYQPTTQIMKLVGANKYLTRREIYMAHASILLVEGIIVPEQDKNNMMTFKGPGRNMPVIKYGFTTEKQGNCNFLLTHLTNVKRVIALCDDISTVAEKHSTWLNSLKEEALHTYETAVVAAQGNSANVRESDIEAGLLALKKRVFPVNAAKYQKRYMSLCVFKPVDMRVSELWDALKSMNRKIKEFPPMEKTLPDGTVQSIPARSMPDDQLFEIFEQALPNAWEAELIKHDINTINSTPEQMVSFCERLEIHEDIQGTRAKKRSNNDDEPKKGRFKPSKSTARGGTKRKANDNHEWSNATYYCQYHGKNTTHSTDQCKVIKATIGSMKTKDRKPSSGHYAKPFYQKKSFQQKEANEIGKAAVKAYIKNSKKPRKQREPEGYQMDTESLQELEQYAASLGLTESDDESNTSAAQSSDDSA